MNRITDAEFETHVAPTAYDNWIDAHPDVKLGKSADGLTTYCRELTAGELAEIDAWALILREGYEDGSFEPGWRY